MTQLPMEKAPFHDGSLYSAWKQVFIKFLLTEKSTKHMRIPEIQGIDRMRVQNNDYHQFLWKNECTVVEKKKQKKIFF